MAHVIIVHKSMKNINNDFVEAIFKSKNIRDNLLLK